MGAEEGPPYPQHYCQPKLMSIFFGAKVSPTSPPSASVTSVCCSTLVLWHEEVLPEPLSLVAVFRLLLTCHSHSLCIPPHTLSQACEQNTKNKLYFCIYKKTTAVSQFTVAIYFLARMLSYNFMKLLLNIILFSIPFSLILAIVCFQSCSFTASITLTTWALAFPLTHSQSCTLSTLKPNIDNSIVFYSWTEK